jgi:hypothetical protein
MMDAQVQIFLRTFRNYVKKLSYPKTCLMTRQGEKSLKMTDLPLDQQIQCNVNFLWPHFVNEISGLDTISQHFDAHVVVNTNFQLSCFIAK